MTLHSEQRHALTNIRKIHEWIRGTCICGHELKGRDREKLSDAFYWHISNPAWEMDYLGD